MRALVVTNMYPSPARPAPGSFARDQVRALRRIDGLDVHVHAFSPGGARSYLRAARDLRRRYGSERFDVVHAHFGLTAWPALAVRARHHVVTLHGDDLYHPRSRRLTSAVPGQMDLVGAPTGSFTSKIPKAGTPGRPVAILPCGIDVERFRPTDRRTAREPTRAGSDRALPALPVRPQPHDQARRSCARARRGIRVARLLTLGSVAPEDVPTWMSAVNAVLCPSEWETFGRACIAALACDVPVLVRPTGAHAEAMPAIAGAHCAEWDLAGWQAALAPHVAAADPRVRGRARALEFSADAMARRVADAWRWLASGGQATPLYSPAEAPTDGLRGAPPS